MRCPNCEKFVSLEFEDPELDSIDIDEDGGITASVRIIRTCQDCGEEMKEATLEFSEDIPQEALENHQGDNHELSIEEDAVEQLEEGGSRYKKSFFGATVAYKVFCSCSPDSPIYEGEMSDKVQASEMEELA